jgi:hypothetical protein
MQQAQTVIVYAFGLPEFNVEGFRVSTFKAPRELIVERYRGEVLEGTAEEVRADQLDDEGCFRRIATAWGELA